jgi:hypothetical protein
LLLPVLALAYSGDRLSCINNQRILEGAKVQLKVERQLMDGATVEETALKPYLKGGEMPLCPDGGHYSISPIGVQTTCSISAHSQEALERDLAARAELKRFEAVVVSAAIFLGAWAVVRMRDKRREGTLCC